MMFNDAAFVMEMHEQPPRAGDIDVFKPQLKTHLITSVLCIHLLTLMFIFFFYYYTFSKALLR